MKTILVTGAAGFIGYHLCEKLLHEGYRVIGLDNINDYYDVNLKYARLGELGIDKSAAAVFNSYVTSDKHGDQFQFIRMNLEDREELPQVFNRFEFAQIVNLAAQAGVRYSLENPMAYVDSNIVGFVNILECCRHNGIEKLVYASSSSVYGNSADIPFSTDARVDQPISLYAATKKSNELMAHTYSHLYDIQTIGLRFFTVYGPWGRPDMAMFLFTDAILNDKPIKVFNNGDLSRDFTYIADIIQGLMLVVEDNDRSEKYKLYNIGNSKPEKLLDFINELEQATGRIANKVMMEMQPGDVNQTWADVSDLKRIYGYNPIYPINEGIKNFVHWHKNYYQLR